MSPEKIRVTLLVPHGPYQKALPAALAREGMLGRVFNARPLFEILEAGQGRNLDVIARFPTLSCANQFFWRVMRRIPPRMAPEWPVAINGWMTDHFWAWHLAPCSILHIFRGSRLATLQKAKRNGAVVILENAGRHVRHWNEANAEELRRFGVREKDRTVPWTPQTVRHVEKEYEQCDFICVPSELAKRSMSEFGLGEKTLIVAPGVDVEAFAPPASPRDEKVFRVCFVARVDFAKGTGYLLQAWKKLALPNAELVLAGGVRPEVHDLLKTFAGQNVRVTGYLLGPKLPELYHQSDVFVLPSVNEGLAQVFLEAMASGLPIIGTDFSGADELITEGKEGFVVPVRDADALAERILWCYRHREELRAMGAAARARIEQNFTLEHYNQRMIAVYRQVAGKG